MKATIEYVFPDELEAYEHAMLGAEYRRALDALREAFRSRSKHVDEPTTWSAVYELFWETLKAEGVELG